MQPYNWLETINVTEEMLNKTDHRLPIIWISALDCTGCKEAFTRSFEPSSLDAILNFISLEYSELLSVASGFQVEEHKETIFEKYKGQYVLAVEGGIPGSDEFLMIAGKSVREEIIQAAKNAKAVIAVGSCSAWGGITSAGSNPTNSVDLRTLIPDDIPVALVPGCPPIPEVIVGTFLHIHFHGELPELDKKLRPKAFYQTTVHMTCHRKPYFDQKLFAESYDDEGARKGYCLFKLGCKGPTAFNACESIVSERCISAGFTCIGCSEKNFWDKGSFCGKKKK
ncbi:hydrogenase small subunit [Neobacillus massiliamazoniensis]|uniref:[Ni/Fe] hydrogenase small subunit n=1 Tax=Neobacillus massiliamazoniensis TaxID=1499688 RepID=A0A0U1P442_9BACI|nr:hydrogenase small subunit [Neobacillus massiliamazoniensis]CRK84961.1 [Ni/Fe] hydrogenase small subunit [Neobacillus massiliamazoniensis]